MGNYIISLNILEATFIYIIKKGITHFILNFRDNDVYFGTIIYHLLQVAQYNAHEIYEISDWNITTGVKLNSLGLALNPSFAVVNHSCDPNAIR